MVSLSQQSVNVGLFMTVGVLKRRCVCEIVRMCVFLLPSDCTTQEVSGYQRGEGNSY